MKFSFKYVGLNLKRLSSNHMKNLIYDIDCPINMWESEEDEVEFPSLRKVESRSVA